jgi:hypothetical protein
MYRGLLLLSPALDRLGRRRAAMPELRKRGKLRCGSRQGSLALPVAPAGGPLTTAGKEFRNSAYPISGPSKPMPDTPFASIDLHLKYIALADLGPAAERAMQLCFYGFFAEEKANVDYQRFNERLKEWRQDSGIKFGGQQPPFRYRRFAGDSTLPRGCYYSLADGASGNDHGTLLHELVAYCHHDTCGRVVATDVFDPGFADDIAKHQVGCLSVDERAINLMIFAEPIVGGELLREVQDLSPPQGNWVRISVPYRTKREFVDKVIDLREIETRDWIVQQLERGLPGVAYQYGSVVSSQLTTGDKPAEVDSQLWLNGYPSAEGVEQSLITFGPCDEWDRRSYGGPGGFFDILPYLVFGTNGGSPVTDAIGRWLRGLGANGLVYPSTRNDVSCVYHEGRLESWTGWNFVDYRSAPPPDWRPRLIVEPDSWRFQSGEIMVGAGEVKNATIANGYDIQQHGVGPTAGSWWIKGRSRTTKDRFYLLQQARIAGEEMRYELRRALAKAER